MTSNIHISWDGPFTREEQVGIRHWLGRCALEGDIRVCQCGILLLMVSRGDSQGLFCAHLSCGCGNQSDDKVISLSNEHV